MAKNNKDALIIEVEARINTLERELKKASQTSKTRYREMQDGAKSAATRMDADMAKATSRINANLATMGTKAATVGKGLAAAFGAGFLGGALAGGLDGIVSSLKDVASGVAEIGDQAKRAGLSMKAFQELKFVAEQNRIGVDALVDGLKELNLRADEWIVTGGGSAAEAFQRLGYSAEELQRKLKDPSALLVEIIGRMEKLNRAARIRVSDELFGGSAGERFVELIDRGADSLRATIDEANRLGIVLNDDVINRAAEIDRQFGMISATVSTKLKGAILEVTIGMRNFLNSFNELDQQTTDNITRELAATYNKRQALIDQLSDMEAMATLGPNAILEGQIAQQKKDIEALAKEAEKLRDILDRRSGYSDDFKRPGADAKEAAPEVDKLASTLATSSTSAKTGAEGIKTYADGIRALKGEIPGLSTMLAELDGRMQIEAKFQATAARARNGGELNSALALRNDALRGLAVQNAGSDPAGALRPRLRPGQSEQHITGLSGDFSKSLAEMMAAAPESVRAATTINSGFRSFERQAELFDAAVKKYGSEAAARKWVAPPGKSQHNAGNAADLGFGSDEAKKWFHENAASFGLGFPMRHEPWHIQSNAATQQQQGGDFETRYNDLADRAASYRQILEDGQQYIQQQQAEQQALGMTAQAAAKMRFEQELFNQAQQAGITLTPQQRGELSSLAGEMARVEEATRTAGQSQQEMQQSLSSLGQFGEGVISSLINGTFDWRQALQQLIPILIEVMNNLMNVQSMQAGGGGGGGLGGLLGGLFGSLFGGGLPASPFGGAGYVPMYANGAAFFGGRVVNSPTAVSLRGGKKGIMGEAGPEAIMPLSRGADGKLGIQAPVPRLSILQPKSVSGGPRTVNSTVFAPNVATTVTMQSGSEQDRTALAAELARRDKALEQRIMRGFQGMQAQNQRTRGAL